MIQGLLLVDKPANISSFGVVARVRKIIKLATGQKVKIGHSGTLDPAATGLLILALGSTTKKLSGLQKQNKTYLVTMHLGKSSSTGDCEGDIKEISSKRPSKVKLETVFKNFTGVIEQTPPAFSAIKIKGIRAYKLARQGQPIDLPARKVTIYQNQLLDYHYPLVTFRTTVSSGTYIRSLVEDMGQILQVGAYTANLRRLSIGEYQVDSAVTLKNLTYNKICKALIGY